MDVDRVDHIQLEQWLDSFFSCFPELTRNHILCTIRVKHEERIWRREPNFPCPSVGALFCIVPKVTPLQVTSLEVDRG